MEISCTTIASVHKCNRWAFHSPLSELLQVNKFDFGKEQKALHSITNFLSQFLHPTNLPFGQNAVLCHLSLRGTSSYVHKIYAKKDSAFCKALKWRCPLAAVGCTAHKEGGKPILRWMIFSDREIIHS